MNWMRPGDVREQEVSWLDWSSADDLSADGKQLLFSETREGGGADSTVFAASGASFQASTGSSR